MSATAPAGTAAEHLRAARTALDALERQAPTIEIWAHRLARSLPEGARLLVAGNGGSAAEAQHLTAELVGRYRHERRPLSAIALHAETSSLTAIANDYGIDEIFARQVRAHGRSGDTLLCLSTSGRSADLLGAVTAGRHLGADTWALTGPDPNPLADLAEEAVTIHGPTPASVQEAHLVAIHLLCETLDHVLGASS